MIPKLLHRIWIGGELPFEFQEYGHRWKALHPAWSIHLWDGKVPFRLVNQDHFDRAQEIIPADWKRFRADLLRLELLYQLGGVYVDTDIEPLRAMDALLDTAPEITRAFVGYSPNRGQRGKRLLTNAVIGAEPLHPFIRRCIDELPAAVEKYRGKPLAQMIGPHHVSRVFEAMTDVERSDWGLRALDERWLYPADRDHAGPAFTFHHWANRRDKR